MNSASTADSQSSSGPLAADDEKLKQVREWFEQLSNGGRWKERRDREAYEQIRHVNVWHILLGLCYSVAKSPEHRMSSLAYAVPQVLEHAREMKSFPAAEMLPIAYKTMWRTLNCIKTGKWTIPDWETGKD
jgi:hypothetical protein